ncbi:MAG: hypothetical protein KA035_02210 [Candidatus Levybacteria bacterium]|nr:hypothetical protein [Candidatus Levybacteria bacterium]
MTEPERGPIPPQGTSPIVVQESLDFLKRIALSQKDMRFPNPVLGEERKPITTIQEQVFRTLAGQIRGDVISKGEEKKLPDGRTLYSLDMAPYWLVSTSPYDDYKLTGGRLLTVTYIGNPAENDPDVFLAIYTGKKHNYDLVVNFLNTDDANEEPVSYDSKRVNTEEMDQPDYEISTHHLNNILKVLRPEKLG